MVAIVQTITLILAAASGLEMVMAAPIQNENVEAALQIRPSKRPNAPTKPQGPTKVLNPTKPTNSLPVLHSSVARPPTTQSRPPTTQSRHSTTQAGPRVSATQTQKGSSTSTPTHSPSTGANFGITCDKFSQAVVAGGKAVGAAYPAPSAAQCQAFLGGFKAGEISSAREAAMFLTNMAWESDGLRAKEEYQCKQTPSSCYSAYGPGNGKGDYFWGRGYTQLSWGYNYKAASQALYGDDRLYQNPKQVATNEDMAWGVSFWFWKANVHTDAGVQAGNFGSSVNKINGALECKGANKDIARKRYTIYKAILPIFAPGEAPKEAGCYN